MENGVDMMSKTEQGELRGLLQIVISCDCPTCGDSRAIAVEMSELFPTLTVDLVDLDGGRPIPDGVVATPTYLLNGKVISLGNPRREDLIKTVMELQAMQAQ